MAVSHYDRVGKALELLKDGLSPFVQRELKSQNPQGWFEELKGNLQPHQAKLLGTDVEPTWDAAMLLTLLWDNWNQVFARTLGRAERSIVQELRDARNNWAHQGTFSGDDAYRALDSIHRLLLAVGAPQAQEVDKSRQELLRQRFDDQRRHEEKKTAPVESQATHGLKPWRDVVNPHPDVASGRFQQAEFAADLWQVHIGEGSAEYKDPAEFFRRTFLTESLKRLLSDGARRVAGKGGDPVVQLQTNFGGGKTHSMLALYHLFSGRRLSELVGIPELLASAEVEQLPSVTKVVLVGNKLSPGNPVTKPDGTVVRTLWGELAYQLGGKKAYAKIKDDDERATSPGDRLRELFNEYGPALVLIDEWVAYARMLHEGQDMPGGTFETQFTFAQALTESARLSKNCLLVISLPASDTAGSPHAQAEDIEVGGARGREALDRLRNVIGRVESSWRPASAEEGFEIVRRRLFEPLDDQGKYKDRDVVARSFYDLYRSQHQEFPPECNDPDYERRLQTAYPIHPEVFDRLYSDWSSLAKFQRTRGVLRLMAAAIYSLWEKGDRSPLIMPCHIPIDDQRVQFELTRYLSDNWVPVIAKDVDGPTSLPLKIDSDITNLGRFSACRRVARTIYMGSAPTGGASNRGLEDRRIKLGCVVPGESPAIYGDALRRMASASTYLYQDGARYWYSTQPTVTKLADDRAEQLKRDVDGVIGEIETRVKASLRDIGNFSRIHAFPRSGADVDDALDARLVVLSPESPYSKDKNAALDAARAILESRGNTPRIYRNSLVFLAVDKNRLQDLDEAVRRFLAWESIVKDKDQLNLDPNQVRQAETQRTTADGAVTARLPEAYQWLLVPEQKSSKQAEIEWSFTRLASGEGLAARASRKLTNDELLFPILAPVRLKMELDKVLWRGNHVEVRQLIEDFGKYLYLPRLSDAGVLTTSIREGVRLLTWQQDAFALADSYDEEGERYQGLVVGQVVPVSPDSPHGLVVKADVAARQLERETQSRVGNGLGTGASATEQGGTSAASTPSDSDADGTKKAPTRYHATVRLDPERVGRDAGRIAEEVISHLTALVGSEVTVVLEVSASIPDGASVELVRTVTENGQSLRFDSQGFED